MKQKHLLALAVLAVIAAVLIELGRETAVYPVSPVPPEKGIGHTLYIASCEADDNYLPYVAQAHEIWVYLFQAPLEGEEFDPLVEKVAYRGSSPSPTYMDSLYTVETYRTDPRYPGVELMSKASLFEDSLTGKKNPEIQKKLNALAPETSETDPLYLVWCGGSLYAVVHRGASRQQAYLLCRGADSQILFSLPEIYQPQHTPRVVALGPITEEDYIKPQYGTAS